MYQALYSKWRPRTFSDVVGQDNVTETLKSQVESGRLSHAYIFSGARGTGKTTCARILAKAVNCESPRAGNPCNECAACIGISNEEIFDITEIDAASNNGVDNVRDLREEATYTPASVKKRVYIIDEVHMFSASAFNAFLKILEEPPAHVMFILATTELHKIPATISSRCQRFRFKRLTTSDIKDRLLFIARNEEIEIDDSALEYISSIADGGLRDAVSLLEQCASYRARKITIETIEDVVGLAGNKAMLDMLCAISERDIKTALKLINTVYIDGRNLISVLSELSSVMRDILVFKSASDMDIPRINARYKKSDIQMLAEKFEIGTLISCIDTIQSALSAISVSDNRRIDAELCIVKLCGSIRSEDYNVLNDRISALEKKTYSGVQPSLHFVNKKPEQPVADKEVYESEPIVTPEPEKLGPQKLAGEVTADAKKLWSDILESAKPDLDPGIFEVVKDVKPIFSERSLLLVPNNIIALNMLKKRENTDILHRHAKAYLGYSILIKVGEESADPAISCGLEELCLNLQDKPNVTIKS